MNQKKGEKFEEILRYQPMISLIVSPALDSRQETRKKNVPGTNYEWYEGINQIEKIWRKMKCFWSIRLAKGDVSKKTHFTIIRSFLLWTISLCRSTCLTRAWGAWNLQVLCCNLGELSTCRLVYPYAYVYRVSASPSPPPTHIPLPLIAYTNTTKWYPSRRLYRYTHTNSPPWSFADDCCFAGLRPRLFFQSPYDFLNNC